MKSDRSSISNSQFVHIRTVNEIEELQKEWTALEARCQRTFFTSWTWIGPWIRIFSEDNEVWCFRYMVGGKVVGLAIFGTLKNNSKVLRRLRKVYLNDVPRRSHHMCIEYNGLLCEPGLERDMWRNVLTSITSPNFLWRELIISRMNCSDFANLSGLVTDAYSIEDTIPAPYVEISKVSSFEDFVAGLSANQRYQLRRARKHVEERFGEITVYQAKSVSEALQMFRQLGVWHTQRWSQKDKTGAFSNDRWVRFHEDVIRANFDLGAVQLVRVSAGQRLLGYLYLFIMDHRVSVLQSGMAGACASWDKPGLLSYVFSIVECARSGMHRYDFLGGFEGFKKSLANQEDHLLVVKLRRNKTLKHCQFLQPAGN